MSLGQFAEMTDIAEQHVRLRPAVVLLQWAIDRYQREKQAPMPVFSFI